MTKPTSIPKVAIIGGGPAGLMAADVLLNHQVEVHLYDRMPSLARKFLMAGKSGMNLSHSEDHDLFLTRYGTAQNHLRPHVDQFTAQDIREWAAGLGIETFVGSSGKIFPTDYKAAPLLRAWLRNLRQSGLHTHVRHEWQGWDDMDQLRFKVGEDIQTINSDATILAMGGASWARLGSDGHWANHLAARDIGLSPFQPSNCGFDVAWSEDMKRHAGTPIKTVSLSFDEQTIRGDLIITATGVEGSSIYALSARLRDVLEQGKPVNLSIDLLPDRSVEDIQARLSHPRGKKSLSTHIQKALNIRGPKFTLLKECTTRDVMNDPQELAQAVKALPLPLKSTRPLDEAISTAGGVKFSELDDHLMIKKIPGLFCAGEMLDWEAPTGGYLLTACFATGRTAGRGVAEFLEKLP